MWHSFVSFKGNPKGLLDCSYLNEEKIGFRLYPTGKIHPLTVTSSTSALRPALYPFFPPSNFLLRSKVVLPYPSASLYVSWDISTAWLPPVTLYWTGYMICGCLYYFKSSSLFSQLFQQLPHSFICWFIISIMFECLPRHSYCLGLRSNSCPHGAYVWGNLWFSWENPLYTILTSYLLSVFRWGEAVLCVRMEWNSAGDQTEGTSWHLSLRTCQVSWACICEKGFGRRLQVEGSKDGVSEFGKEPAGMTVVPGYSVTVTGELRTPLGLSKNLGLSPRSWRVVNIHCISLHLFHNPQHWTISPVLFLESFFPLGHLAKFKEHLNSVTYNLIHLVPDTLLDTADMPLSTRWPWWLLFLKYLLPPTLFFSLTSVVLRPLPVFLPTH